MDRFHKKQSGTLARSFGGVGGTSEALLRRAQSLNLRGLYASAIIMNGDVLSQYDKAGTRTLHSELLGISDASGRDVVRCAGRGGVGGSLRSARRRDLRCTALQTDTLLPHTMLALRTGCHFPRRGAQAGSRRDHGAPRRL